MKLEHMIIVAVACVFEFAFADPIAVQGDAAANTAAIQSAIDAAAIAATPGTVTLGEGLFEIDAQLMVTGGVKLVGQGWEKTTIRQTKTDGVARCMTISGGAEVFGLTLTGGRIHGEWNGGAGAMIENGTLSWCRVTDNQTGDQTWQGVGGKQMNGGGVNIKQGTVEYCEISHNAVYANGGGESLGGAIYTKESTGPITIDTCLIYGNRAPNGKGGAICAELGNCHMAVVIRNSTIADNSAAGEGGAVYFQENGNACNLSFIDCVIANNTGAGTDPLLKFATYSDLAQFKASCEAKSSGNVLDNGVSLGANSRTIEGSGAGWFVDAANGDYHLNNGSEPVGAGRTYSGIANDLDNRPFADPPSAGCYEAGDLVSTPTFDPASDTEFYPTTNVTIGCETAGVTIRYTLDGTVPTDTSAVYTEPIVLSATTMIKARAFADGISPSPVSTAKFICVKPTPQPEEFSKCVEITLDTALATTEITTGLPALVKLSPDDIIGFDYADFTLENGGDMMFTDADGRALPHEVDTWNPQGESLVWVKLPSTAANTVITLYYGNGTTTSAAKTDVWSDYVGVWHLNEAGGANTDVNVYDSTVNGFTGVAVGHASSGSTDGKIGSAWTISDSSAKGDTAGGILMNSMKDVELGSSFTVSAWLWHRKQDYYWDHVFYRKNASGEVGGFASEVNNGSYGCLNIYGSGNTVSSCAFPDTRETWAHYSVSFGARVNSSYVIYTIANGGTPDWKTNSGLPADNGMPLAFGTDCDNGDISWKGAFDEIRIRKGDFDENYLRAEYKAMNTAATDIFSFGMVQDSGRPIEGDPIYRLTIPAKTGLAVSSVTTNAVPVAGVNNTYLIVSNTAVSIAFEATSGYEITGGENPVVVTIAANMTLDDSLYPTVQKIKSPEGQIVPGETAAETRRTIQDAIDLAATDSPAGTVTLAEGLFLIDAELMVTGGVKLVGQGWDKTVLKQTTSGERVVTLNGGAKLEGVTVTGGKITSEWTQGAGVLVKDGSIAYCRVTGNTTGIGGTTTVKECYGAGVSFYEGKGSIDHSLIDANTAANHGGGACYGGGIAVVHPAGPVTVDACLVYGNSAPNGDGGGVYAVFEAYHQLVTVRNTTIANNTASRDGSAIYERQGNDGKHFDLKLVNCVIADNTPGSGDAIAFASYQGGDAAAAARVGCEAQSSGNVLDNGTTFGANSTTVSGSGAAWFVDAEGGDYHLAEGAAPIAAGVVYDGLDTDLDGIAFKDETPSAGCYEFGGPVVEKKGVIISFW